MNAARFSLGRTVITAGALACLTHEDVLRALGRHASGDWGEVCPEDHAANEHALTAGLRLVSVYHAHDGTKFYVITEWDRSATTVLLPEDY